MLEASVYGAAMLVCPCFLPKFDHVFNFDISDWEE